MTEQQLSTYEKCIAAFPDDALSCDSSRGFDLTSVKAQYVNERLNEAFGSMNWNITGEYEQVDKGVLYKGVLTVTDPLTGLTNKQEACGYAIVKKNIGDAFKGSQTDALSKCASRFGVANEVFKGNVLPPGKGGAKPKPKGKGKTTTTAFPTQAQAPVPFGQQQAPANNPFASQGNNPQ